MSTSADLRITVAGAGAIGGFIAARLAAAGTPINVLARGQTLATLQRQGLRLVTGDSCRDLPVKASDTADDFGVQDLLIIAVKGPSLPVLAPSLRPLIGPQTTILPTMNGVPWWFCQTGQGYTPFALKSVDPDGSIARHLPTAQTLGCVVHIGASCDAPGVVRHAMGKELILGDARGGFSPRTEAIAALFERAGLDIKRSSDIRQDIWYKLWGNLTMNPVSALTGATIDRLLGDPLVSEFCSAAMREAAVIGDRIGCHVDQQPEDRHAITFRLGAFKTSMLQDVEAGRPIELDSIVGATYEIGHHFGMQTPCIDGIFGLTRLMARTRGLYPDETRPTPAAG
ncbi:2-dehydropantoate 2-reductase [Propionivibrio dicarboxylicus]|uniref:2-dehydropantoate 2-reductase n=1 Tax=Propionivibrio dicarboxylicus TaxID=83767 RepID=A0A1G7Y7P4_9RHOO|nr:2-dehydropantoate 2-reductase [Propionivibrio dicarboxylicus]SDG92471.1 2-dehydropantoate 2-reductase [Propionivibrio dicarboxylicus]